MPLSARIHRRIAHNSLKPGVNELHSLLTRPDVRSTISRQGLFGVTISAWANTWGNCREKTTIFLDGVAIAVSKHLEAALRALRSSVECQLGMKVWADALCINQADIVDLSEHVLRVKGIFSGAFSVTVWTNECDDIQVLGLQPPGERFLLCEKNHETVR